MRIAGGRKEAGKMRTRREMNGALAAAAAAMLAGFRPAGANPQPGGDAARITGPLPAQSRREAARAKARPAGVRVLLREPLAEMPHAQVTMITLSLPPGSNAPPLPHRTGTPARCLPMCWRVKLRTRSSPTRRGAIGRGIRSMSRRCTFTACCGT
jgi:hypothetical protein